MSHECSKDGCPICIIEDFLELFSHGAPLRWATHPPDPEIIDEAWNWEKEAEKVIKRAHAFLGDCDA